MPMIKDKPSTNLMENTELAIELYDAYEKLSTNPYFTKLIEEGFLDMFTKNQVGLLATIPDSEKKKVEDSLIGVSILEKWLLTVQMLGESAKRTQEAMDEAMMNGEDDSEVPTLEAEVGMNTQAVDI